MLVIQYQFMFADDSIEKYEFQIDDHSLELPKIPVQSLPDWCKLDFCQCDNCPLSVESSPACPVAAHLSQHITLFDKVNSYDEISLQVKTNQRIISQHTTAQRAISGFIGLLMATSGCPHSDFFKPMARFHLPLADEEETIYRAASMYLLAQYFRHEKGKNPDWELEGLKTIYENMGTVNRGIADRLRAATKTDSSVNAVVSLDTYAKAIPLVIEETLDEIEELFSLYYQ